MPRKLTQIYNLDPALKARILESAKQDRRSFNLQIQVLVEEALNSRDTRSAE